MKNRGLYPIVQEMSILNPASNIKFKTTRLWAILALLMVSNLSNVIAQKPCEPCAIERVPATMSAPPPPLRPTCDAVNFTVRTDNTDFCNKLVQVDFFFISPESGATDIEDLLNDMVYTGAPPIFFDTLYHLGSGSPVRQISIRITVPAGNITPVLFPFLASAVGKHTPNLPWDVLIYASAIDENGVLCKDYLTTEAQVGAFNLEWELPYSISQGTRSISELIADEVLNAAGEPILSLFLPLAGLCQS